MSTRDNVLEVRDLRVQFERPHGARVLAVDGVSLDVVRGETLAVCGPSGCGKSTLARAIVRLVDAQAGQVLMRREPNAAAVDLLQLRGERLRVARRAIGIVFQDPFASLNPRLRVGSALDEVRRVAGRPPEIAELLEAVGLSRVTADRFPHELSGGQRQRVALARALAVQPEVLICDEILSALDVSIQAQILELLMKLRRESRLTLLFITHDMAVVRLIADRVASMGAGRLIREAALEGFRAQPSAGSATE